MDDNEYSFEICECRGVDGEKLIRFSVLNPTIEATDDGDSLRVSVITGREGAEAILDSLAGQIDEIWG